MKENKQNVIRSTKERNS